MRNGNREFDHRVKQRLRREVREPLPRVIFWISLSVIITCASWLMAQIGDWILWP